MTDNLIVTEGPFVHVSKTINKMIAKIRENEQNIEDLWIASTYYDAKIKELEKKVKKIEKSNAKRKTRTSKKD